jgi:hypothetical protein
LLQLRVNLHEYANWAVSIRAPAIIKFRKFAPEKVETEAVFWAFGRCV